MKETIALITGASSGMGKAAATALSSMNILVIMLCRDKTRGMNAWKEVKEHGGKIPKLMICDLADLQDIKTFCKRFHEQYDHLDILINNAGVITLDRRETADGLELQFGVNHIGHFFLTTSLLDLLTAGSRIVIISSGAHKIGCIDFDNLPLKKGYSVFSAYGRAKLCNILFAKELSRRLADSQVLVNCVHPGAVATNMGIDRNTGFGKTITRLLKPFFLSPEDGAKTAVYLATAKDCEGISGEYFYRKKIARSSKKSQSEDLAKKLWSVSEEIIRHYTS